MAIIHLALLGGLNITDARNNPIDLGAKKARALLAYLALSPGKPFERDHLANLLWPDSKHKQARHSLRQTLAELRKHLPDIDSILHATNKQLSTIPGSIQTDVLELVELAKSSDTISLKRIIELYRGEFLAGDKTSSSEFLSWREEQQLRFHEYAIRAMEEMGNHYLLDGAWDNAVSLFLRLTELDPIRESAHRSLMELYARQGRFGSALRQYRLCSDALKQNLKTEPEEVTRRLYDSLRLRHADDTEQQTGPGDHTITANTVYCHITVANIGLLIRTYDSNIVSQLIEQMRSCLTDICSIFDATLVEKSHDAYTLVFFQRNNLEINARRALTSALLLHQRIQSLTVNDSRASISLKSVIDIYQRITNGINPAELTYISNQHEKYINDAGDNNIVITADIYKFFPAPSADVTLYNSIISGENNLTVTAIPEIRQNKHFPVFTNRNNELRQLFSSLETARLKTIGHVFRIDGKNGVGKTRLVSETVTMAQAIGYSVFQTRLTNSRQSVEGAITKLLRVIFNLTGNSDEMIITEQDIEPFLPDRSNLDLYLAVIQNLLDLPVPKRLQSIFNSLDRATRQYVRQKLLADLLRTLATSNPVLLVVEDCQFAARHCNELLSQVINLIADLPLIVIFTSENNDSAGQVQQQQTSDQTNMSIGRFNTDNSARMIRNHILLDLDDALALANKTTGIPLDLTWLIGQHSSAGADNITELTQLLVHAINKLDAHNRDALYAAVSLGQEFRLETLRSLIDNPHYNPTLLVNNNFIRQDEYGYEFTHIKLQQLIYRLIPKQQLNLSHKKAAAHFLFNDSFVHAQHLAAINDSKTVAAYLSAATTQRDDHHYARAAELYDQAFRLAENSQDKFTAALAKGSMLLETGSIALALQAFETAQQYASDEQQQALAWSEMAIALIEKQQYLPAKNLLARCKQTLNGSNDYVTAARIHYHLGLIARHFCDFDEYIAENKLSLEFAKLAGSLYWHARSLFGLALACLEKLQIHTAHEHFKECLRLIRESNIGQLELPSMLLLAKTQILLGNIQPAIEGMLQALSFANLIQDRRRISEACMEIAHLYMLKGNVLKAKEYAMSAADIAESIDNPPAHARALSVLAIMQNLSGEQQPADITINRAHKLADEYTSAYPPSILAIQAWLSANSVDCLEKLLKTRSLLETQQNKLVILDCCFYAIEAAIKHRLWEQAENFTDQLVLLVNDEPSPWIITIAERTRLLSCIGQSHMDSNTRHELVSLLQQANQDGLEFFLPAYETALSAFSHNRQNS